MNEGLEEIVVADTELSEVDGAAGRLQIRGIPVEDLAGHHGFEQIAGLLLDGRLPDASAADEIRDALGRGRAAAFARLEESPQVHDQPHAMDLLRTGLSLVPLEQGERETAFSLCGAAATLTAAFIRRGRRAAPAAPDAALGHADDIIRMIHGHRDAKLARGLDTYLGTVIDHGMCASTFAARVVASTESDLTSAVVAAVGALKGRLHGGAPGPVLDMLDAVEAGGDARRYVDAELAAGRRIMGMGHRVYRVRDPRAAVLERAAVELGTGERRIELARELEQVARARLLSHKPHRPLNANVEFYTALLLEALAVPRAAFTALFACSRIIGYSAHVMEQRARGRLIRPRARYVGQTA